MKKIIAIALGISLLSHGIVTAGEDDQLERKQIAFFKDKCSSQEQLQARGLGLALAAILLPKFIETGIEIGFSAIKKAAEDKSDAKFAKTDEVNIAKVDHEGGIGVNDSNSCLVYFDGYFKEEKDSRYQQSKEIESFCAGNKTECILKNAIKSHIFFETKLDLTNERRLSANMTQLFFGDPVLENSFFSSEKDRDLVLTIDILSYETEKPYGSIAFQLNNVRPKETITFNIEDPAHGVVAVLPKDNFTKAIEKQNRVVSDIKTKIQTANPRLEPKPAEEEAEKFSEVQKALQIFCDSAPEEIAQKECPGGLNDLKNDVIKARAESIQKVNRQRALEWLQKEKYDLPNCNNKDDESIITCLKGRNIKTIKTSPLYIKVTAIETKKGSMFWTKFADAILSTKGEVAKTIAGDALKDKDKLKAIEVEQEATDLRVYELAKDQLRLAEATQLALPADATDVAKINVEIAIKKAKMDVNASARKLGIAQPYPELP